jgi:hypothetical protein
MCLSIRAYVRVGARVRARVRVPVYACVLVCVHTCNACVCVCVCVLLLRACVCSRSRLSAGRAVPEPTDELGSVADYDADEDDAPSVTTAAPSRAASTEIVDVSDARCASVRV